ncbi:YgaP family membrane protein [Rhodanobacter sp. UC4450_H17]|jgi:hypothetical protein
MNDSTVSAASSRSDADRVRRSTSADINREIDRQTEANIHRYRQLDRAQITGRIQALDAEWDVERVLEVNASTLALSGLVLGVTVDRRWLWLTGIVLPFLLQHGLQGWCPPLPVLRRLGIRTRAEIDREKYALLAALDDRQSVH